MRGALVVMVLVVGLTATALRAVEQTVTPLAPPVEQRVEAIAPAELQRVEALDPATAQDVGPVTPVSQGQQAASKTGKVFLGFMAVVLSLAAMAAQIMFI